MLTPCEHLELSALAQERGLARGLCCEHRSVPTLCPPCRGWWAPGAALLLGERPRSQAVLGVSSRWLSCGDLRFPGSCSGDGDLGHFSISP